jgi:hypothetical protein
MPSIVAGICVGSEVGCPPVTVTTPSVLTGAPSGPWSARAGAVNDSSASTGSAVR